MIYPQANNASAGGSAGKRAGKNSSFAEKRGVARKNGKGGKPQQVVQWKQKNVQEGIVVVDEQQLSKLIKREPIEKHYTLDPEPFATGLFASVRRCVSLDTGEAFAAKFSSRARYGEDCSAEIHHEIALLSLCAPSPRIVKLHDVYETPTEIIILMQFAPGGDLQTVIDDNLVPFETDVVNFVRQLVEGLAYLHERKIAHLDIKPQNLVMMGDFPNCDVKLCDFEISRVILEGTEIREILGTPDYVAPEILHYEPITLAADLWSLGVTTYVLLTGFSPFGGETDQETFCNISRAQLDFPEELFEDVSQDAKEFIQQLLVREPSARPTAKNLLRHRWLSRHTAPRGRSNAPTPTVSPSDAGEKNLRKYLSKSREALFERVVQQQQQGQRKNDLRKTTLLSQYNKTRMCESHTSLVSRTREERPLVGLSPSFSRSREKLYGLRSLSRSHEGLDLLKLSGRNGGESPRAYARATTAELGMLPLSRPHESSPSIAVDTGVEAINTASEASDNETSTVTPISVEGKAKTFRKINSDSCISVSSLVSPTLLKNTLEQCSKLTSTTTSTASDVPSTAEQTETQNGFANDEDKTSNEPASKYETTLANHMKLLGVENNEKKIDTSIAFDTPRIPNVVADNSKVQVDEVIEQKSMNGSCAEEKETGTEIVATPASKDVTNREVEPGSLDAETPKADEEIEEPTFTVAQLISAYNRHQEIVTKTSLEVTMTTDDKTAKISPPIVAKDPSTKFPTGPTALRLFIPDIDIETTKKKKNRTKSYRTLARSSTQSSMEAVVSEEVVCDASTRGADENGVGAARDLDQANNNTDSYVCSFVLDPPTFEKAAEKRNGDDGKRSLAEINPNFLRSASLSSETSGGLTPSETLSSLSWEEVNVAPTIDVDAHWSNHENVNLGPPNKDGTNPWGRLCTGSYTRAMEKFGGKNEPPTETKAVTNTRKCSLSMLFPAKQENDEKVRRKSTSVIVKLS